jgi:hypothetical protein
MLWRALADLVVVFHCAFVLFVVLGGLLALRWPRLVGLHLPAVLWGAGIEFVQGICPLTPLENHLRARGGQAGYSGGFVEHYLLPVLYPAGLNQDLQLGLGAFVVVLNLVVYGIVWRRWRSGEAGRVLRQIDALDARRQALLGGLEGLDAEALATRPGPDRWSILEIVEHLVIAERDVFRGFPEIMELKARRRGFKARFAYVVVMLVLRAGIPVKVPSRAMVPRGERSLDELRGEWDENFRRLRDYAAGLDREGVQRAVFRHPVAGPITLAQALRLDRVHLARHARQIRRLRAAAA